MTVNASTKTPIKNGEDAVDVLIVGAGFSGIYLLNRLRKAGFKVLLCEAGSGLGGVWHWNCYPGARVDSPCWMYQFSQEELWRDWDWSEVYPGFIEMRQYFNYVNKKLDLSKNIRFETRVTGARFDEDRHEWRVETTGEAPSVVRARFLMMSIGFAAKPYTPSLDGIESFQGISHHTALWPQQGVNFKNQRVGIIGTGASGIQVAQEASKEAAQLTVFQRTPNLCLPMQQKSLTPADNRDLKKSYHQLFEKRAHSFAGFEYDVNPKSALEVSESERKANYESLWQLGGFKFWLGNYSDMLINTDANHTAYNFWRDKVRERVKDPTTAAVLAPDNPPHPFGVKRPSLEQWYFDIFNEDHVRLVDVSASPIDRVTPKGLQVAGHDYAFDVLVMATGFDAVTGGLTQIDIRSTAGVRLEEKWKSGVRTYQGLSNAGFPNMMVTYGPQAPTAFCNGPTSAEFQGDYIVTCLEYLRERGLTRIEATEDAEKQWKDQCAIIANETLFPRASSWYMGANIPGKYRELLMYSGGVPMYLTKLNESATNGYAGYSLR